ncbi:MAG: pyruvate dehydrogenase (acetyl-transferring), homodimeric type [Gemmataceae bacterium]
MSSDGVKDRGQTQGSGADDDLVPVGGYEADAVETQEWLDALEAVLYFSGKDRAQHLLSKLGQRLERTGVPVPWGANTPYINTIPADKQPTFPGNREIERRIKSMVRWNAMAMVIQANEGDKTIGGHIGTFASSATLYEIGFNHFFKGPNAPGGGDLVYFQGHASPGMYARAFLEGRLTEQHLKNFRRELAEGGGLSSYPHPWLMPNFWQFPTVSMGLGPIMAIYQARFNRYLENRGMKPASDQHVWCFTGDGEMDEPESLGAITLAGREGLDNLIFVINCNLQRLDGPVRGNGKIVQELEAAFRGAGWNCIKVLWGSDWDPLFDADRSGLLVQRMGEVLDGEYQKYVVSDGKYTRQHFFGKYPELYELVKDLPDDRLAKLKRGGHDPVKVYAAYKAAVEHHGSPTVILVSTVKGYGLGEAGEGMNSIHQIKLFKEKKKVLTSFRDRFNLPLTDDDVEHARFLKLADGSPEMQYLHQRRQVLGGYVPQRRAQFTPLTPPGREFIDIYTKGSGKAAPSTTMAFVDMLERLLKDTKGIGRNVVPIIPDEARTFGMDPLFTRFKIYSSIGQLYTPVDDDTAFPYREAKTGQLLEEGITEAGSMSSFIAAGTAYATHGVAMVPFFIYYSMFGFQRVGDLCWAAGDLRCRGFMMGATAGRTTLNGEGLQHEDGHSQLLASTVPNVIAYDPSFAYELAVILNDGIRRMYGPDGNDDVFYYITLYNENYAMPAMPDGAEAGILKGLYRFRPSAVPVKGARAHLLGSGPIMLQVMRAQEILAEQFGVAADVWSATSYKELRRDALEVERWNFLHPAEKARRCYVEEAFAQEGPKDVYVAASDFMRAVPEMIARWVPGGLFPLGTDGFGRSESRAALRRHFEVDAECIALAALYQLSRRGVIQPSVVQQAIGKLNINPEKVSAMRA